MARYRSERLGRSVLTAFKLRAKDLELIDLAAAMSGTNRSVVIREASVEAAKKIVQKDLASAVSP